MLGGGLVERRRHLHHTVEAGVGARSGTAPDVNLCKIFFYGRTPRPTNLLPHCQDLPSGRDIVRFLSTIILPVPSSCKNVFWLRLQKVG